MDKAASKKRFEQAGLAVASWSVVDLDQPAARLAVESWPMPFVIKPVDSGSSFGVSLVCRMDDVEPALQLAAQFGRQAIIEAFVAGREITVGILGEEPLPVIEIRPRHAFFDFAAKYTPGETDYLVPAPLPTAMARAAQHAALEAHHALGCRHLSRADFILDAHGVPVLLEVNTIPGFTPTSLLPKAAACAGMTYEDVCERLVVMAQHSTPHAVTSS
jgi:D-alanine-D-alanine ligase